METIRARILIKMKISAHILLMRIQMKFRCKSKIIFLFANIFGVDSLIKIRNLLQMWLTPNVINM